MSMRTGGRRRARATRTLWSLAVLGLLRERSMHPYEMQRQLHLRHTDTLLGLKRGSLYHAINQLLRAGLIEPLETSREGRWPERTVYRITPDGEDEMIFWLRDLLSTPLPQPSSFTAALAHILQLDPRDAMDQLQMRVVTLQASIAAWLAVERGVGELFGRVSILEVEYARSQAEAELVWLQSLIDDVRAGRLTWSLEKIKVLVNTDDVSMQKHSELDEERLHP